ncbi:hypothetical protein [Microbacterium oxydans]|uniref:Uncharacterized protein n=1 Tax=Microbacterium oxydans TaxID=82380 RepID=A0A0F0L7Y1_9MICO|nr:hypothetical protein [Microbacterium oxydans]KJL27666.1 hypothetical protein RS83_02718 [Microbacterium oxydans]
MRTSTAWFLIAAMTAVSVASLALLMAYRFDVPLVSPAPPTPDYGIQALVAGISIAAALAGGVGAGLRASKREHDRRRIVGWTAVALFLGTVLGTVLAFVLSAR